MDAKDNTSIINDICSLAGKDVVLLAILISIALAKNLTTAEQGNLGNFLMTIGQNLSTISGIKATCILNFEENLSTNSDKNAT